MIKLSFIILPNVKPKSFARNTLLLISLLFLSPWALANSTNNDLIINDLTIADLVEQGKLKITLTLPNDNEEETQIVGQAFVISIEVATERWFAKGSTVEPFSVPHAVIPANNIITTNGNQRIAGTTWSTQTHYITLYPNKAGIYNLPNIAVNVSVNTENNGVVMGIANTKPVSFEIGQPEALQGIDSFIVSSAVTLTIDGQFDAEKTYAVGDAITQTITITADDIPAMMIPEINNTAQALDGISVYHKPAKIFDNSNRGTSTGTRVESFTYIFENAGDYTLPENTIYWWNTNSNALEQLKIPASSWTVYTGGLFTKDQASNIFRGFELNTESFFKILTLIVIITLLSLCIIKRQSILSLYKTVTHYDKRQLRKQFYTHIANKNYLLAENTLYQYLSAIEPVIDPLDNVKTSNLTSIKTNNKSDFKQNNFLEVLNTLAFASETTPNLSLNLSVADAKQYLATLESISKGKAVTKFFTPKEYIKLN
ncbi:BatD family protein [Colwellia echini]|nr:BatD family protein [Colwellia echini]